MRERPGAKRPKRKARIRPTPAVASRPAAGSIWKLTSGRSSTRRSGPSVRAASTEALALRSTTRRVTPPATETLASTATGMPAGTPPVVSAAGWCQLGCLIEAEAGGMPAAASVTATTARAARHPILSPMVRPVRQNRAARRGRPSAD